jgi:hypothetical protein
MAQRLVVQPKKPTRLVGAGPAICTLGLSLILVRLGASTLKG